MAGMNLAVASISGDQLAAASRALSNPHGRTMIVARGQAIDSSILGLEQPKQLLGGHCLGPDGIATQAGMDWIPGLSSMLADACRRQSALERPWFWLPPVALTGATPEEARHVSRRIARLAGVPCLVMDASRLQKDALGRTGNHGADLVVPPDPVVAIATSGCANPLVLVLGANEASDQVASDLADLIDRQSSARWLCGALGTVLDLSAITWMVATPNEHSLHTSLYTRLRQLAISVPDDDAGRMLRVMGMVSEVMADHQLQPEEVAASLASMISDPDPIWEKISRYSAGALHDAIRRELLRAAHSYGS